MARSLRILRPGIWYYIISVTACFAAPAANPIFVTSDPNGGWSEGGYYVHNNLWNSAKYSPCTSTLYA